MNLPLFNCQISDQAMDVLRPIMQSGQLASGPAVAELENDLAQYLGNNLDKSQVVAMNDMTQALTMALRLSGVQAGDEVLTLSYNCLASNAAISALGAIPRWVDINPESASLCLTDAAKAMTSNVKALIAYHVAGYPADLPALREFCDSHQIPLIEDANNALGATWAGRAIGTWGDFAVFSFYANRQVNGIEGAALVCADKNKAQAAQKLRRFGIDQPIFRDSMGEIDPHTDIPQIGYSASLNHVNATLAKNHLHSLDERINRSLKHAKKIKSYLENINHLKPIQWDEKSSPSPWVALVRCTKENTRNLLLANLKKQGIQCSKLHQPNHVYTGFRSKKRDLSQTNKFIQEILAIPCGWWLKEAEVNHLLDKLSIAYSMPTNN
jgi:perosamine synthetase